MVAFKNEWDKKCYEQFGIPVTRVCATQKCSQNIGTNYSKPNKLTFEDLFYKQSKQKGIRGFPMRGVLFCNSELKKAPMNLRHTLNQMNDGLTKIVHYVGIAADEPKRICKHIDKKDIILPLVQIGWDESLCGLEAEYLNMLSPTYTKSLRDGCWFCHNQSVGQLRNLRADYPDLWSLLLKWDSDSPTTFKSDGHTVHDYDKRFQLEDEGVIKPTDRFKWKTVLDIDNSLS